MAREMKEEIARIQCLRDEALESAGLAASPPQSAVFDWPDEGFGYRIGKVQKRAFDPLYFDRWFKKMGVSRCRP